MQKPLLNLIKYEVCLNGKEQCFTVHLWSPCCPAIVLYFHIIPVEEAQACNNYEMQEEIMKEPLTSSGSNYDSVLLKRHSLLEWVSKANQFSYSIKVLHDRTKFSDVQKEYGANQSKWCLIPLAWNISQAWAPTNEKLLTGIWLSFFFKHQTPNSSLSKLALLITLVPYTFSHCLSSSCFIQRK